MKSVASNIWKYTIFLITNKRVFIAIIGTYYLSIQGVDIKSIGYILLAGNISGFLFEIPSGYLSDIVGHRKTLILSRISMLLSSIFFLFASGIGFLIIGAIFMALGFSFTSGTASVFFSESLDALGRRNEFAQLSGKIKAISFAVPLLLSVSVPFLVNINMRFPFVIAVIVDFIGLIISISFIDPSISKQSVKEINTQNFIEIIKEGERWGFNKLALFSGFLHGVLMAVGVYRSAYQEWLLLPVIYFGLFFGAGRLLASYMLSKSGKLKRFLNIKQFFILQILVFSLSFLGLGLVRNPWIIAIIFLFQNGFKWGFSQLTTSFLLDSIQESRYKATLLSMKAQIGIITTGITGFILGTLIHYIGYTNGFLYLGIIFLIGTLGLYLNAFKKQLI